jgi:hypothetical protein
MYGMCTLPRDIVAALMNRFPGKIGNSCAMTELTTKQGTVAVLPFFMASSGVNRKFVSILMN